MTQEEILQKIRGEERLAQALSLSDFTRELAIKNIKEQLGNKASQKAILRRLEQRLIQD